MPTKWIDCGSDFIQADVIRWREPIWGERRRRKWRPVGECVITGEVLEDQNGWTTVMVRRCEIVSEMPGRQLTPLPKNEAIRRKREKIERGHPQRRRWCDETARGSIISRFLGRRDTTD